MFRWWIWLLVVSLSIGCRGHLQSPSAPDSPKTGVIKVTENHKYKLEAIFAGEDIQVGERVVKVIESVTVRSKVTGQEVKYDHPLGPDLSEQAYFTDVWSPDEEFVVLPINRVLGFCITRAADALDSIKKHSCFDTVNVRKGTPPKEHFWHDFEKWDGPESFIFKAGLYGDYSRLKYEISSGRLTALDSNLHDIEGTNGKGNLTIAKSH